MAFGLRFRRGGLVPVLVIFSATRHSRVTQRAFLMLNATGLT